MIANVYIDGLRALTTIPAVSIHFGHFLTSRVRMPLAGPPAGGPHTVEVLKTEEKGSDVNLATYLISRGRRSPPASCRRS